MKKIIIISSWLPISFFLLIFCFLQLEKSESTSTVSNIFDSNLSVLNKQNQGNIQSIILSESEDLRVIVLKKYFTQNKSVLAEHAKELVDTADRWGIDYTILPAIAMQESLGCKRIPEDSYNCWGYGIYGDKITRFSSYREAMEKVAQTIKLSYINNGLTNPTLLEDKWAPPSRGIWSFAVNFFISQIKEYEKDLANT